MTITPGIFLFFTDKLSTSTEWNEASVQKYSATAYLSETKYGEKYSSKSCKKTK